MRIGIDFGGTKIEGVTLDRDGIARDTRRVANPGDYDGAVEAVGGVVDALEAAAGEQASVGVGIPGSLSPATGLVRNANSVWMNGRDFKADLKRRLARPIRLQNDANCFAVSEAVDGAAAGAHVVFGVILGTGTGGGIAIDGRPLTGRNAIAGEWGHNPLPWPRPDELPGNMCFCGRRGCIETFLSGPGLAAHHAGATGRTLQSAEIIAARDAGDGAAIESYRLYVDRLARALAHLVNILDPDVIVLGGGMSNVDSLYHDVPPVLARYIFSDVCTTPILKAAFGDSSGVRGAAWLWPD
jgi:fructokinase